jgi:hypothetical protein
MFALLVGIVIGAAGTVLSISLAGSWYEYRLLINTGVSQCDAFERQAVVRSGWRVVPGQQDVCYFERPRFRFQ